MEITNEGVKLSQLEKTIVNQQAKTLAVGMYQIENGEIPKEMDDDTIKELDDNYMSVSGYVLEMYAQQPHMQDAIELMGNKLSSVGVNDLESLLRERDPKQMKFLNKMYQDSITGVFGEGEEGALAYIESHLNAQQEIYKKLESQLSSDEELRASFNTITNLYTGLIANQAETIFGQLPQSYQHLLQAPANNNYAPSINENSSSDDKAA